MLHSTEVCSWRQETIRFSTIGMAHLGSPKALLRKKGGRMLGEFRDFAMRGSMLDMAVGIIVGAAFGRVVSSFVSDILMPPIGLFSGHSDFSNKFINLSGHSYTTLAEAKAAGAATINYGIFFNALSDFLIVAFVVFMLIRQVNRLKSEEKAPLAVRLPILSLSCCDQSNPLFALHLCLNGGLRQVRNVAIPISGLPTTRNLNRLFASPDFEISWPAPIIAVLLPRPPHARSLGPAKAAGASAMTAFISTILQNRVTTTTLNHITYNGAPWPCGMAPSSVPTK
jgi:large conductance mechanosensitive channel